MPQPLIDLLSDAYSPPSEEIHAALCRSADDAAVAAFEAGIAEMFGKEAALFIPTTTMANLIAAMYYAKPGEQVLLDQDAHLYRNELGNLARVGGLLPRVVPRNGATPDPDAAEAAFRDRRGAGDTSIRLLWLELTHNVGGGAVADLETLARFRALCDEYGVPIHVDGARIFNAAVALKTTPAALAAPFDSISVGINKAVAAPFGCLLVGPRALIDFAIPMRRMLGGFLYKVSLFIPSFETALAGYRERIERDHQNARRLGERLAALSSIKLEAPVATNIIRFDTSALGPAADVAKRLLDAGVRVGAVNQTVIRAVTHRGVDADDIERAAAIMKDVLDG